ncbi:hypothetical protein AMJ86_01265 [bacterium SM23_57]|jgi:hypothetical protein|nr:MAG: hypothetical protein AMJ86_01265 [bacterium SM23_57]
MTTQIYPTAGKGVLPDMVEGTKRVGHTAPQDFNVSRSFIPEMRKGFFGDLFIVRCEVIRMREKAWQHVPGFCGSFLIMSL